MEDKAQLRMKAAVTNNYTVNRSVISQDILLLFSK